MILPDPVALIKRFELQEFTIYLQFLYMSFPFNPEQLRTRLIWANERSVEPEYVQQTYEPLLESRVWYLKEGSVLCRTATESMDVPAGRWVFLGHTPTEIRFSPGSRIVSISFHLLTADGRALFPDLSPYLCPESATEILRDATNVILENLEPWKEQGTLLLGRHRIDLIDNLAIEAAFYHFLSHYCRLLLETGAEPLELHQMDERVHQAVQLLTAWDMRIPFSEEALAASVHLGPAQLRRLFEKAMGRSPFQYYDRHRWELADHSLREGQLPMKELAYELGFSSPAHFSNWFRNRAGMSPGAYRKQRNIS